MTFAEYLVIALLVVGGILVLVASQPWEGRFRAESIARDRPGGAPSGGQIQMAQEGRQGALQVQPQPLQGKGKVYFVPVGTFPSDLLQRLVGYYREKYGMTIETLSGLLVDRAAFDERRDQLVAEELIASIKRNHHDLANDPEAILIGITRGDMYIRRYTWRFAFAYRDGPRFAVVSTARMDPVSFDLPADPAMLEVRLRKMVTKQIGIMHFGLPQGNDRNSVMYGPILGLDDLDSVGEEF